MKISVICIADRWEKLPGLYWSLVAQDHKDWELIVLDQSMAEIVDQGISQVAMMAWPVSWHPVDRLGDWGQTAKENTAKLVDGDVLMFPNDDAYYVPTALSQMVAPIEAGVADIVICGWLYDLFQYKPMAPRLAQGYIDVGGFMIRRETFLKTGWPDKTQTGDFHMLQTAVDAGARVVEISNVLYVKN